MKLLIADDHPQITDILNSYAKKEGYETRIAANGQQALALFASFAPDVVLLDVMMPLIDGFEVCRRIRETSDTPVIMVTARGEDFERIMGLDIGADDYIVKPFSPAEVMARVRAVLRRTERREGGESSLLKRGSLQIDLNALTVRIHNQDIRLTRKEFDLLRTLAEHPAQVFTRDHLLSTLWGYDYFGDTRTVDSHIKRLRAKLDARPHEDWDIATIWGMGYRFEEKTV